MGNTVTADAKFLRRVFFGLIGLTLITGAVAGFTTVNAMNANLSACVTACN
jgi:hypothetical protein